jgi:hypothetical protein
LFVLVYRSSGGGRFIQTGKGFPRRYQVGVELTRGFELPSTGGATGKPSFEGNLMPLDDYLFISLNRLNFTDRFAVRA